MAVVYYPKNSIIVRRDTISSSFEELVLSTHPNVVLYFNTASAIEPISLSMFVDITCSYALTASFAKSAVSSSWASSSFFGFSSLSSSWSSQSFYSVSSSWASSSVSASWAPATPSDTSISSSWASSSLSSSFAQSIPGASGMATVLFTTHTSDPVSASITGQTNMSSSAKIQSTIYASNDDILTTVWATPVIYNVINATGFSIYIRPLFGTYSGSVDVFWTWRP